MSAESEALRDPGAWDLLWRGSFGTEHDGAEWVVDVDYFDVKERIRLYRDGQLVEAQKSPARFVLDEDTAIVAAMTLYGMKRVDLVDVRTDEKREALRPRRGTAEAWRARLSREQPGLNRGIGIASWCVLVFALATQLPVAYNSSLAHLTGHELPTLELPVWANAVLGVAALLAGLDRALQLKHNKWIDS